MLDGFPRTRAQAEYLFEGWNLDRAIYLEIPDHVVYERVAQRVAEGQAQGFTKRADDNAEALKMRLKEYYEKTLPLLDLFEKKRNASPGRRLPADSRGLRVHPFRSRLGRSSEEEVLTLPTPRNFEPELDSAPNQ